MGDFEERLKEAEEAEKVPSIPGQENSAPEEMNLEFEKEKGSNLKKIVLFSGIIFIFLVFFTIILTSGVFGGNKISEKQLIVGASFTMQENKSVKLEIQEEEHEIIVENVGEDWAEIVIRSDPLKFTLKVNEVIELDLDNDGQSDIRVKLFKIQNGEAVIAVKRIDKESCVEDWVCEDWGGCADGKRIRECFDLNECGSEFFKPFYEQKCVGNNPVEVNETEQVIKGMEDVIKFREVNFTDNVVVNSNMSDNENDEEGDVNLNNTNLNEENETYNNLDNDSSDNNVNIEITNESEDNQITLNNASLEYGDNYSNISNISLILVD